jgi:membrane protease YdiL (CAAX protease family)
MSELMKTELLVLASLATPAAVFLGIIVRRGWLRPAALQIRPRHDVGLGWPDVMIALVMPYVTVLIFLLQHFQPQASAAPTPAAPPPAWDQLMGVLLAQLVTQLPFVLWLLARTARVTGGWRLAGLTAPDPLDDITAGVTALPVALALVMTTNIVVILAGTLASFPAPELGHDLLRVIRDSDSAIASVGLILAAVVFAPVLEEFMFRGLLQASLAHVLGGQRRWTAVLLTSTVFALVHASAVWQVLPGLFVLSVILGWLYERRGSIWASVVLHGLFNAINVGMVIWFPDLTGKS